MAALFEMKYPPSNSPGYHRLYALLIGVLLLALAVPILAEQPDESEPAEIKVAGYGLFGNRELLRLLRSLEPGGDRAEFLDANFVEDSVLLLVAKVRADGYLKASLSVQLTLLDGNTFETSDSELVKTPLPRDLQAHRASFKIEKGIRFFYDTIEFEGLELLSPGDARSWFVETGTLFRLRKTRIYTPDRLRRSVANLAESLGRRGYQNAEVKVLAVSEDELTGSTDVRIAVQQRAKHLVTSSKERLIFDGHEKESRARTFDPPQPYSRIWQQDYIQGLVTNQYAQGYPDTRVEAQITGRREAGDQVEMTLEASIHPGSQVRVGAITFSGQNQTRESFLHEQIPVETGDLLNPIEAETGRQRLAQLGIFDSVKLSYQQADDQTRALNYELDEAERFRLSLLFGYGSYELLRGGFETELVNILGRAHRARLKAIQSFKATSGDFTYSIPQLFTHELDLFIDGSALRREEVSFVRKEYGGGAGLHKYLRHWFTDVTLRYSYEILDAANADEAFAIEGRTNATVSAMILDLKHDRRDNPLYPRKGYRVFSRMELASDKLGGEVTYQRVDASVSWHHPLAKGTTFSIGLEHGAILTLGSSREDLPYNRRFFPGGENSLRGYKEGEASPRDSKGLFVGAETIALATVEFEQALTPKWSLVLFSDSLGFAREIENYPFDSSLFSVGVGLRWRTIVGPVRLEYGHNLNPREDDPSGTLHFSLGFPF